MKFLTNKQEEMSEVETYFWIVQLVSGSLETGGVVVATELVTKKWERVEGLVNTWSDEIDSGEFYASVIAVRAGAEGFFARG